MSRLVLTSVLEGWHRHRKSIVALAHGRWVLTGWSEVSEGLAEGLLVSLVLVGGTSEHVEGLRRVVAEVNGLVLEVRRLHGLEHELVLVHNWVADILGLSIIEDSRSVVVLFLGGHLARFWWNDLDIAVAWQELHVGRAVEQDFSWDRRQRVC